MKTSQRKSPPRPSASSAGKADTKSEIRNRKSKMVLDVSTLYAATGQAKLAHVMACRQCRLVMN